MYYFHFDNPNEIDPYASDVPEGHQWVCPFDDNDADLVLRSAITYTDDPVIHNFAVHKSKLSASSVLANLFDSARPDKDSVDEASAGKPVLVLSEETITIYALLQFLYNGEKGFSNNFLKFGESGLYNLYRACKKYDMQVARLLLEYVIK